MKLLRPGEVAVGPIVPDELFDFSWTLFDEFDDQALVRPSIPITYFGDAEAYARSPIRIITVGLNPSRREFPPSNPSHRFPDASLDTDPDAARACDVHRRALNSYFRNAPYMPWFGGYEAVLEGADASYLPGHTSVAVHTDVCSPLATDPTWNGLSAQQQTRLENGGVELWRQLVSKLRPQIIVASVAVRHLTKLTLGQHPSVSPLITISRERPFTVDQRWIRIHDERCLVISGRPVNLPFGSVARADRVRIGAIAAEVYAHG